MHITILGGAGCLGRKLAARLAADGALGGRPVSSLTLFDLAAPPLPSGAKFPVHSLAGDLADLPPAAIPRGTNVVFHLAAVVSAAPANVTALDPARARQAGRMAHPAAS